MSSNWFNDHTQEAIRRLANCDQLSLVVGAGTSVEAGLPTWQGLVQDLLLQAATKEGLTGDQAAEFVDWTVSRESLTGAGEIAKTMLGDSFRDTLWEALYDGKRVFEPGETAKAAARIAIAKKNKKFELLTTNYDGLLEQAIRHESEAMHTPTSVETLVDAKTGSSGGISVRHLHGSLSTGNQLRGKLVLSDADYTVMQRPDAWQETHFQDLLTTSTCLFIGTSLTDPNLLRYLYQDAGRSQSRNHVAVFARQQDASAYDSGSPEAIRLREESQILKWKQVGVTPVLVDYYSQSSQFLWELEAACRLGPSYVGVDDRLEAWNLEAERSFLVRSGSRFGERQESSYRIVRNSFETAIKFLTGTGLRRMPNESLQMSLWVYDPAHEALLNWASSDRVWRDPATLEPLDVRWLHDFVSVQAFCTGSMVSESTVGYAATRWNHVIGFPVFVYNNDGRLPVGAVTLASTRPQPDSMLHRGAEMVRTQLIPQLAGLMQDFLEPEETFTTP